MVVVVGLTDMLPSAANPVPTPLSIDTPFMSASVVVQVSVAEFPAVMVVGDAEKLSTVGAVGGAGLTVTVTLELAVPPGAVAVSV